MVTGLVATVAALAIIVVGALPVRLALAGNCVRCLGQPPLVAAATSFVADASASAFAILLEAGDLTLEVPNLTKEGVGGKGTGGRRIAGGIIV